MGLWGTTVNHLLYLFIYKLYNIIMLCWILSVFLVFVFRLGYLLFIWFLHWIEISGKFEYWTLTFIDDVGFFGVYYTGVVLICFKATWFIIIRFLNSGAHFFFLINWLLMRGLLCCLMWHIVFSWDGTYKNILVLFEVWVPNWGSGFSFKSESFRP